MLALKDSAHRFLNLMLGKHTTTESLTPAPTPEALDQRPCSLIFVKSYYFLEKLYARFSFRNLI